MNALRSAPAWALGLTLLTGWASAATIPSLKMPAATQQRLGIATAPLAAATRAASAAGFARVLDPTPLATLDADIAQAAAALSASQAEAARTRSLNAADQTVSRRAAEAAAAQARADAAKLQLLRRRLSLEWGPSIAGLSDGRRGRLIADLAAGRAALVRIDAAGGLFAAGRTARLDLGSGDAAQAVLLGPARSADPRLQAVGLLGLVRGPAALRLASGMIAPATLAIGSPASGVVIPRAALLRAGGQTFAYVRRDAATFERRPVAGALADPAGLFAPSGFRPGEAIVVNGAAMLFAAEQPASGAQ